MNPLDEFQFLRLWVHTRLTQLAGDHDDRGGLSIEFLLIAGALVAAAVLIVGKYGGRIKALLTGLDGDAPGADA